MSSISLTESGFTYLHIPKTAGHSISTWLDNNFTNNKQLLKHPPMSVVRNMFDVTYSFTTVRNPWARLVSLYAFTKQIATEEIKTDHNFPLFDDCVLENKVYRKWINKYKSIITEDINDPEFSSDKFVKLDGLPWFDISTNQAEWIDSPVDKIIKIENLNKEFIEIQKHLNCFNKLPFYNVSIHKNYKLFYNENLKKIVSKKFEKDIDMFKYTFEN